jgi:type IV fimbrial biogenesis protein FimT
MRAQQGFTLIELMVTIAVAAILVALAVPGFQSVVNGNRLATAANEMVASLQTARMEAIRRNRRVAVCTSGNANAGADSTCGSAGIDGWITFVDANTDGDFDKAGDTLVRTSTFSGPVELSGEAAVSYRADGMARIASGAGAGTLMTDGSIRMRIDAGAPTENVRCIDITTGGAAVRTPAGHDASC